MYGYGIDDGGRRIGVFAAEEERGRGEDIPGCQEITFRQPTLAFRRPGGTGLEIVRFRNRHETAQPHPTKD